MDAIKYCVSRSHVVVREALLRSDLVREAMRRMTYAHRAWARAYFVHACNGTHIGGTTGNV